MFRILTFILISMLCSSDVFGMFSTKTEPGESEPDKSEQVGLRACNVCFDEKEASVFGSLTCGHNTCNECLMQMVNQMIKEKDTTYLKCPHCAKSIEEDAIRKITNNDKNILEAYTDIATAEYLAKQQTIQQCPTVDCPFKFFNENEHPIRIICPSCHAHYCSKCLTKHDGRVSCTVTTTNNKDTSTAETQKWLDQNTKACPQCGALIQKDGGCDYVRCRNCQYGFCFNCFGKHHLIRCTLPAQTVTPPQTVAPQEMLNDWVIIDRPQPQQVNQPHFQKALAAVANQVRLQHVRQERLQKTLAMTKNQERLRQERLQKALAVTTNQERLRQERFQKALAMTKKQERLRPFFRR